MQILLNSNQDWRIAKHYKFYELGDQDLSSGSFDVNKTISGFHWVVNNSGSALDVGVGTSYSGLKITPYTGSTKVLYRGSRTACWVYTELGQHLSGTDAYQRDDVEFRITTRVTGNISNYNTFVSGNSEGIVYGLTSPTYNASYYHLVYQGGFSGVPSLARVESNGTNYRSDFVNETSTPISISFIPNCFMINLKEGYIREYAYATTSGSTLNDNLIWETLAYKVSSTYAPLIVTSSNSELIFHFGAHQNIATKQIIDVTLQELKIEYRYTPRGGSNVFW